jgi:FixJ family two-component response regulator
MSDGTGYGKTSRVGSPKTLSAHRWSYEEHVGPVEEGMFIDHLCRVRECVNPAHLEPVTHAENCRRGALAKLTAEQVDEIRALVDQGWLQRDIAASYGISRPTVSNIKTGRSWRAEPSAC